MLKAVIFDMDGVLINSEPVHFEAWKLAMADRGLVLDYDIYKSSIGSTIKYLMELLHTHYGTDPQDISLCESMQRRKRELIGRQGCIPLIEGVKELLKRLKEAGYLLAVASSSPEYYIREVVKFHGIDSFFAVLCSGETVEKPKPAPDVFLQAAQKLGVKPEECIVVEDSTNGCLAAKAAPMACVGFFNPDSGEQDLTAAAVVIEGYEEIDAGFMEKIYCRFHRLPVTVGEGERVLVREMAAGDIPKVWEMGRLPEIEAVTEDMKGTLQEAVEWFPSYRKAMYEFCDMGNWLICEKETGELLGRVGLEPLSIPGVKAAAELGYVLLPQWRGLGLAREACEIALAHASSLELEKIFCRIPEENSASGRLARRLGFVQGEKRDGWIWFTLSLQNKSYLLQ